MRSFRRAALVSGLYVASAGAWIVWSDSLVRSVSSSVEEMERLEHAKGLFFVLTTGLALFAAMSFLLRRSEEEAARAVAARETLLQLERHSLAGLFVSSIVHDANNVATVVSSAIDELKSVQSLDADAAKPSTMRARRSSSCVACSPS